MPRFHFNRFFFLLTGPNIPQKSECRWRRGSHAWLQAVRLCQSGRAGPAGPQALTQADRAFTLK
jgi:hypothetical protein